MQDKEVFTKEEVLKLIKESQMQNLEAAKAAGAAIAQEINNPTPTAEETERRKQALKERIELAQTEQAAKERKRQFCNGQSDRPHRRPLDPIYHGNFAGQSLIVWTTTQFSSKGPNGQKLLGQEVPVGICQWCHTTFQPGDPDYAEALSWGINTKASVAPMNIRTGVWAEN
jgi:hypothetical protein